jgi:hypothetical protein
MRWLLILIAWAASTAVLAPLCFFLAMLLAGPHSSLLPAWLQPPTLLLGWGIVLVGPIWIAHRVWRRTRRAPEVDDA